MGVDTGATTQGPLAEPERPEIVSPEGGEQPIQLPLSRYSAKVIASLLVTFQVVAAISVRTIQRWLTADKLKPWRFRSWITTKHVASFLERACPVLDLYERVARGDLKPGEVVVCTDEKTSIQARERDSYAPSTHGEPAHVEHTYKRRGALCLMAALLVATGKVFGRLFSTKHFANFAKFLSEFLQQVVNDGGRIVHIILDNGSTHRPKHLAAWMAEHFPHLEVHIYWLPVRSSWLDQIEIFFSQLQCEALTPNNFPSLTALATRILGYINHHNASCRPFRWLYTSTDLRRKYERKAHQDLHPPQLETPQLC